MCLPFDLKFDHLVVFNHDATKPLLKFNNNHTASTLLVFQQFDVGILNNNLSLNGYHASLNIVWTVLAQNTNIKYYTEPEM